MSKYFVAVVLFIGTAFTSIAQQPGGAVPGKTMAQFAIPNIGHIFGKITDSSNKPVSGATVVLLQSHVDTLTKKTKEILFKASAAKGNGEFSFEEVPAFGDFKLKVSATGFKGYDQVISLKPEGIPGGGIPSAEKDLGNIQLSTEVVQLQTGTVTTTSSALKLDIDKKVFNVEKNLTSAGGTAVDVMRNVPSVQVDVDGNVKLRNAAPQIYVDGRPTTLSLDQIPADAIQSVEVITNPSAKFDASGGNAGILNIVLRKNKQRGYNGNIMVGIDRRGGTNAGANLSVRQDKVNFSAAFMSNQMKNKTTGTTNRLNFGDTATHVFQTNVNKTNGGFMFGKLGMDYYVTNRATITVGLIKLRASSNPGDIIDITTDSLFNNGAKSSMYSQRSSSGKRSFDANGLQLGYVYNFPKKGEQLTADVNYFSGKNESNSLYTTNYYAGNNINGTQLQRIAGGGSNRFTTIQTDYTNPLSSVTKLEAGLRAQLRTTSNNTDNFMGSSINSLVKIAGSTSNYKNNDNVYAAYLSLKSSIKDFGYQIGLRAESSNYNGEVTNTGEKFSNKYPISLFPSLFLSQKLKNKQELQFSYTRRINRPKFFQLIPIIDYSDSLNITRGNPNLVPEFTSSFEMTYSKTFKGNNNLLGSIYYKRSTDLITRYLTPGINPFTGNEDVINTYINANSSYSYGAEVTSVNYLTKIWDVTTNVNVYKSRINTDNITSTSQDAMISWFGKINNNFKLPKNFAIQLSGEYQSKTNLPINNNQGGGPFGQQAQSSAQGYIRPFWGMDLAVRKSFLKNNAATIGITFSDMFRTRKQDQHSESIYFAQDYNRLNNPQMVRLNFSYRFGKIDLNVFKRQNMKSSATQDAMQMGQ